MIAEKHLKCCKVISAFVSAKLSLSTSVFNANSQCNAFATKLRFIMQCHAPVDPQLTSRLFYAAALCIACDLPCRVSICLFAVSIALLNSCKRSLVLIALFSLHELLFVVEVIHSLFKFFLSQRSTRVSLQKDYFESTNSQVFF